jgi:hypothetical protein
LGNRLPLAREFTVSAPAEARLSAGSEHIRAGITLELGIDVAIIRKQRSDRFLSRPVERFSVMRKFVSVVLTMVAVFALSASAAHAVGEETAASAPTVAVQRVILSFPALRDEALMVLVGTALIGLAAAVRRAA